MKRHSHRFPRLTYRALRRAAVDKSRRLELAFPIVVGGETRDALLMRSPTPEDLAWFQTQHCDEREGVLCMIARLCNIPRDILEDMDRADLVGLLDACDAIMDEI